MVKTVEEMKKVEVKVLRNKEWQIEDELVLKKRKVYVPKDESLRLEIIQLHHNVLIARYEGQWKTVKLVTRNYWCPEVTKEVKQYIEEYDQYQRMKNKIEIPARKLRPNVVPGKPQPYILIDFIMKLLVSRGHNLILVVCNRFSKILYFIVMIEKIMAEGLARLFRDNI